MNAIDVIKEKLESLEKQRKTWEGIPGLNYEPIVKAHYTLMASTNLVIEETLKDVLGKIEDNDKNGG